MARFRWSVVALLLLTPATPAQDSEIDKPYRLQVVLDVGRNRLLGGVFREQVGRELRDALQVTLGDMAQVEVAHDHPRLEEVRSRGLETLARWKELSDTKVHFVQISYVNGEYVIRTRQHDGLTGQASPVVREDRTSDRLLVARLASLLVEKDFGVVGVFPAGANPDRLTLQLKAGKKTKNLGRWVAPGAIFIVVPIERKARVEQLEHTYFQASKAPAGGAVEGRLLYRRKKPLEGVSASYFRCLKVATISAPVRLRVVDPADPSGFVADVGVEVREHGFDDKEPRVKGTITRGRFFSTAFAPEVKFDHVAFVTILTQPQAWIPVPLFDEEVVTVKVRIKPRDVREGILTDKTLWEKEVSDESVKMALIFKDLQQMGANPRQRAEAVKKAQESLKSSREELNRLTRTLAGLRKIAEEHNPPVELKTALGEAYIKDLEEAQKQLQKYIEDQQKILAEENDPRRQALKKLARDAEVDEAAGDIDRALQRYQEAYDGLKDANLKKRIDTLRAAWEIKSEEHKKARQFIYQTWPQFELTRMKELISRARESLKVCEKVGDTLSPIRLLKVALDHGNRLATEKKSLDLNASESDQKIAALIADAANELGLLIDETQQVIKKSRR